MEKTNVMRLLDAAGVPYTPHSYTGVVSGADVAHALGRQPAQVFKTLVTAASSGRHYVFILPADSELDLKKAARQVGEKWVEMLRVKDLLPLTGYVHGGCSPIGMKKPLPAVLDETAFLWGTIFVSAGKIGHQTELAPAALQALLACAAADLCKDT